MAAYRYQRFGSAPVQGSAASSASQRHTGEQADAAAGVGGEHQQPVAGEVAAGLQQGAYFALPRAAAGHVPTDLDELRHLPALLDDEVHLALLRVLAGNHNAQK